jgi:hypothetical protein
MIALASSLKKGEIGEGKGIYDPQELKEESLMDKYDYVMSGKIYKIKSDEDKGTL